MTTLLSPRAVAEIYNVPLRAVRHALQSRELAHMRTSPRGPYRIAPTDVDAWIAWMRQPRAPRVPVAIVPGAIPARRAGRRDISHLLPPVNERMFT